MAATDEHMNGEIMADAESCDNFVLPKTKARKRKHDGDSAVGMDTVETAAPKRPNLPQIDSEHLMVGSLLYGVLCTVCNVSS